ncbi:MAG: hypothetical protein ACRDYU_18125 [Actinomycetes bacterium]
MKLNWSRRAGAGMAIAAGSMAMVGLLSSVAAASPLVDGGGRGPTPEVAIQSALDDAQVTAVSMGFFGPCTIVGEPQVFETLNDPNFGHIFRAQVQATCEQ